jgi:hypothetical protein
MRPRSDTPSASARVGSVLEAVALLPIVGPALELSQTVWEDAGGRFLVEAWPSLRAKSAIKYRRQGFGNQFPTLGST